MPDELEGRRRDGKIEHRRHLGFGVHCWSNGEFCVVSLEEVHPNPDSLVISLRLQGLRCRRASHLRCSTFYHREPVVYCAHVASSWPVLQAALSEVVRVSTDSENASVNEASIG